MLAESISYPPDFSSVSFRLNPNAKWADGQPVTVEDVLFSFEKAKESTSQVLLQHVKGGKAGEREVTFTSTSRTTANCPTIMGQFHDRAQALVGRRRMPDGKKRDVSGHDARADHGFGALQDQVGQPGYVITYELRDDYWGKDLNVNVGQNNFRTISYTYFSDRNVEFEAFRGGNTDYWEENEAKRWQTSYDFPAVKQGKIKKEELANDYRVRRHGRLHPQSAARDVQGCARP
ncbi:MAG: ABC transporter substrate-binding protein [Pirellulales bacterium]